MALPERWFLTPVRKFWQYLSGLSGGKHHAPVAQSVRGTRLKIVPVSVQVRPGVPIPLDLGLDLLARNKPIQVYRVIFRVEIKQMVTILVPREENHGKS